MTEIGDEIKRVERAMDQTYRNELDYNIVDKDIIFNELKRIELDKNKYESMKSCKFVKF